MRKLVLAGLLLLCGGSAALAADGAELHVIGYSVDGRYFAFEQSGVQDGSGFPYSEVFITDLANDRWVGNSPFRAMIEDDGARVSAARAKSFAVARPLLEKLQVDEAAETLVALPANQVIAKRDVVDFDRWYNSSAGHALLQAADFPTRWSVSLRLVDVPVPAACQTSAVAAKGFQLEVQAGESDGPTIAHEDKDLPASRGCPVGYDIAAIVSREGTPKQDRLVAIIAAYGPGFEGLNRRYLAVPLQTE